MKAIVLAFALVTGVSQLAMAFEQYQWVIARCDGQYGKAQVVKILEGKPANRYSRTPATSDQYHLKFDAPALNQTCGTRPYTETKMKVHAALYDKVHVYQVRTFMGTSLTYKIGDRVVAFCEGSYREGTLAEVTDSGFALIEFDGESVCDSVYRRIDRIGPVNSQIEIGTCDLTANPNGCQAEPAPDVSEVTPVDVSIPEAVPARL